MVPWFLEHAAHPKSSLAAECASVSSPSTTLKGTGDSIDVPMRIAHATDTLKMYMESPKPAPTTGASIVSKPEPEPFNRKECNKDCQANSFG